MPLLESIDSFLRRAAPLPKFLSMAPTGLDITDRAVRVLRLDHSGGQLVPGCAMEVCVEESASAAAAAAPLPPGAPTSSARRATCKTLPDALILAANECGLEQVVVSIPESKTYIFTATVPLEAMSDLRSAIEFRVQENVPLPPESVAFDYQVIGKPRGGEVEVAVTAVPKADIATRLEMVKAAGLTVSAFDTEARSLARALVPRGDMAPHLILNMEPDAVTAVIVERGVAQFSSIIPVPGEKAAVVSSPYARELKEEANKLLVYWFTGNAAAPRQKVEEAIVTGPCAATPGIADFLARGLQIQVRPGNTWQNCFPVGGAVPEVPRDHSHAFAAAAGLALLSVE